jgi:DNA-directed RNA polymerase specialized sigma24 family protein
MISDRERFGEFFDDWDNYQQVLRKLEKFFQWQGLRDSSELSSLTVYRALIKIHDGAEVPIDKMWPFLRAIADRIAREAHAHARRRPSIALDSIDPVDEAGTPDLTILLSQVLARMPKEDRQLLEMAVWKNTKRIAVELGISEGNVRLRLHHVRRRLREIVGQTPKASKKLTKARAHGIII